MINSKSKFSDGQKLSRIRGPRYEQLPNGVLQNFGFEAYIGWDNVKSIEVCMEHGQMEAVPWALVEYVDGTIQKYNLALMEWVELMSEEVPNEV